MSSAASGANTVQRPTARGDLPQRAAALQRDAIVVDGHVHVTNRVLSENIDPWKETDTGAFDFARARKGGLKVVIEHLYVDDRYNDYNYTVKQACRLIETFYRVADKNRDKMEVARSVADVRRIVARKKLAVVLALEGGFDVEGDLDVLRLFHRLGVRMVQLMNHNTYNAMIRAPSGDCATAQLTETGKRVIQEMNDLGIVIDISHACDSVKTQIIETSRAPVVTSHNGLGHFNELYDKNLTDETLRALARKRGMLGLHSMGYLISQDAWAWNRSHTMPLLPCKEVCPAPPPLRSSAFDQGDYVNALDKYMRCRWCSLYGYGSSWQESQKALLDAGAPLTTVSEWADQVKWVIDHFGEDSIGLGLDLMGGGIWAQALKDFDATSYPLLTEAMLAKGLQPGTVRKVLGENWLRLFEAVSGQAASAHSQSAAPGGRNAPAAKSEARRDRR